MIFEVMTHVNRPVGSAEILPIAESLGLTKKLWARTGGVCLGKTPGPTIYARMSENAQSKNPYLLRVRDGNRFLYSLIPGRSPRTSRSLDYDSPNVDVYMIRDARLGIPFYVGLGKKAGGYDRKLTHTAGHSHSKVLAAVIAHAESIGHGVEVVTVASGLRRAEARALERAEIAKWGRRGIDLTGVLFNAKA